MEGMMMHKNGMAGRLTDRQTDIATREKVNDINTFPSTPPT